MGEIVRIENHPVQNSANAELAQMREALEAMAALLRQTAEAMEDLRRQVRTLEKLTPGQASQLNAAVRSRAGQVCGVYCVRGFERTAGSAIRKALRERFGTGAVKEIPRCEYSVALELVRRWDDFDVMMEIRRRKNEQDDDDPADQRGNRDRAAAGARHTAYGGR